MTSRMRRAAQASGGQHAVSPAEVQGRTWSDTSALSKPNPAGPGSTRANRGNLPNGRSGGIRRPAAHVGHSPPVRPSAGIAAPVGPKSEHVATQAATRGFVA